MTRRKRRLMVLLLAGLGLGSATALTLTAFQDNLVFFFSPSDVLANRPAPDRAFRLGGLVEAGSVDRRLGSDGRPTATFRVTDGAHAIAVVYAGVLPDLFREGQGVVTLGRLLPDGTFRATEVLARHDETYMPPEVADALRRSGHWNPSAGGAAPARGTERGMRRLTRTMERAARGRRPPGPARGGEPPRGACAPAGRNRAASRPSPPSSPDPARPPA